MTPLHVAAKMGASDVAELLVRNEADTELRDDNSRTALEARPASCLWLRFCHVEVCSSLCAATELSQSGNTLLIFLVQVAVESGVFPRRRLHLLANFRIADIMIVSEHCPSATTEFIRNLLCDYADAQSADKVAHKTNVG
jgi:hypothetical protein